MSGADPTRDCRAKPDSDPRDVCPVCRAWLLLRERALPWASGGPATGLEACADPRCEAAHGVRRCLDGAIEVRDAAGGWSAPMAPLAEPEAASPDWAEFRRLQQLADAAAKANAALERIGEQARQRIVELTAGLREALDAWYDRVLDGDVPMRERLYRLADRAEAETPAGGEITPAARFQVVADLAREGKITTEQARTLLEMPGMDAKQIHRAVHLMLHPVTLVRPAVEIPPPDERARRTQLAWWTDLIDEQREALIRLCCYTCGALNPSCRCGDDE